MGLTTGNARTANRPKQAKLYQRGPNLFGPRTNPGRPDTDSPTGLSSTPPFSMVLFSFSTRIHNVVPDT